MQKHTRVYLREMGYDESDWIGCELNCGRQAVDINHIIARGMGGTTRNLDTIDNLMAMCRECHTKYGDNKFHLKLLKFAHNEWINIRRISTGK